MAIDVVFPIYEILVENVFGSYGMAILGVAVVLFLMLAISRASMMLILFWMGFYFMVMGTMYLGGVGLVLTFLFSSSYLIYGVIKFFFREG